MRTRTGQPQQVFHPTRIGPYEVVRRLGAGAMGEVFLARSASSRLVAVKTIRSGLAEHPGYRRRFAHEVDAAKRVSGAFTAAVVDADAHADLPWLATVYVPAPSLEELVANCGPLAVSAVRWVAAGCAEALECVHRAGLVHRDFKPANVLVTADGPRVIDFGLARSDGLPQGTAVGMVMGTPLYMAPEQAMGDRDVGPAADVFALGATLYHAATGAALYQEEKAVGVLMRKMRQPPDLAQVPRELRALIAGCLALEPDDRPSPGSMLAALAPHLAGADAARPLPDGVLDYIEDYRGLQMELARSRRSMPQADTAVVGESTHVAVRDDSGRGIGSSSGSGEEIADDDARPGHPSLPPGVPMSGPHGRTGWWDRDSSGRRPPMGQAVIAGSVLLALSGAAVGGLLLVGTMRNGSGDASKSATDAAAGPPPTHSPPPPTDSAPPPTRQGPPPFGGPPPNGPPNSPPPGAVTEVDGTRLGVRPPFGDPRTTYILNGAGWPAGQTVTVTFLDAAVPPATTVVDSGGTFSVALDRGAGSVLLPDGRYHVRASSGGAVGVGVVRGRAAPDAVRRPPKRPGPGDS